jgi:hypothetical protein
VEKAIEWLEAGALMVLALSPRKRTVTVDIIGDSVYLGHAELWKVEKQSARISRGDWTEGGRVSEIAACL